MHSYPIVKAPEWEGLCFVHSAIRLLLLHPFRTLQTPLLISLIFLRLGACFPFLDAQNMQGYL